MRVKQAPKRVDIRTTGENSTAVSLVTLAAFNEWLKNGTWGHAA